MLTPIAAINGFTDTHGIIDDVLESLISTWYLHGRPACTKATYTESMEFEFHYATFDPAFFGGKGFGNARVADQSFTYYFDDGTNQSMLIERTWIEFRSKYLKKLNPTVLISTSHSLNGTIDIDTKQPPGKEVSIKIVSNSQPVNYN